MSLQIGLGFERNLLHDRIISKYSLMNKSFLETLISNELISNQFLTSTQIDCIDIDLMAHEEICGSQSRDQITCQYQSVDADQTTLPCCQSQY